MTYVQEQFGSVTETRAYDPMRAGFVARWDAGDKIVFSPDRHVFTSLEDLTAYRAKAIAVLSSL